jgi:hypothetical protein
MITRTRTTLLLGIAFSFSVAALGCERSRAAPGATGSTSAVQAAAAKPTTPKVARIVFVGKEHACDCTRKSVDAGWTALQQALGTPAKVPVERLQIDTQGDKVAPYRQQKPMMALPAIYFVDGKNMVLELLQGEVTEQQIITVLDAKKPAP